METNKLIRGSKLFFPNFFEMMSDFPYSEGFNDKLTVNVKETDSLHQIQLSAPGYKKENFKIDIEDNVLTISNKFEEEKSDINEKWTRKEFKVSSFSRGFYLPEGLNTEDISASYENGILYIDIPKMENKIKKTINIEIK